MRGDGQIAPPCRQEEVNRRAQAVCSQRVPHGDRHPRRGGDHRPGPRLGPLVPVLLHRQAPLDAANGQPPALLGRPPIGRLDDRILVQFVAAGGLVDHLVHPPAQFRQDRHAQGVVLQHQQGVVSWAGGRGGGAVAAPIEPSVGVGAVAARLETTGVGVGGDGQRGGLEGGRAALPPQW
jgi:hypothetical protein